MLHKIYSFRQNPQSKNSSQLHLTELNGSEEEASQAIEALEAQGHSVNGWLQEREEDGKRRLKQVLVPSGKKGVRN